MRWEGRRQSSNVEDRRGMRVSRGGLVGGGLGTLAIALIVMFLGGDPTAVLQGVGEGPVQTTNEPYVESPNEAEWSADAAAGLAFAEDTWGAEFKALGGEYRNPRLVVFNAGTETGCGMAPSAVGPFYCPPDEGVYIDLTFFDELATKFGAGGDAAQSYVLAHEIGHHVQNLLGVSSKVHELQQRVDEIESNQLSVRLELQADCYAGLWMKRADEAGIVESGDIDEALTAANAVGDDRLQKSAGRSVMPDSFTHGTSEQRQRWFQQGFRNGSLEACDSFKAADL